MCSFSKISAWVTTMVHILGSLDPQQNSKVPAAGRGPGLDSELRRPKGTMSLSNKKAARDLKRQVSLLWARIRSTRFEDAISPRSIGSCAKKSSAILIAKTGIRVFLTKHHLLQGQSVKRWSW